MSSICGRHKINGVHGVCEDCERLDTLEHLEIRVKELEEHRFILGDNVAALAVMNGKLRRVADVARKMAKQFQDPDDTECSGTHTELCKALCDLDGHSTNSAQYQEDK